MQPLGKELILALVTICNQISKKSPAPGVTWQKFKSVSNWKSWAVRFHQVKYVKWKECYLQKSHASLWQLSQLPWQHPLTIYTVSSPMSGVCKCRKAMWHLPSPALVPKPGKRRCFLSSNKPFRVEMSVFTDDTCRFYKTSKRDTCHKLWI